VVASVSDNATSWSLTGSAAPVPGVSMPELLTNLSLGHAVINIYTANFPQPLQPMGCCNNAEARPCSTCDGLCVLPAASRLPLGTAGHDSQQPSGFGPVAICQGSPFLRSLPVVSIKGWCVRASGPQRQGPLVPGVPGDKTS